MCHLSQKAGQAIKPVPLRVLVKPQTIQTVLVILQSSELKKLDRDHDHPCHEQ